MSAPILEVKNLKVHFPIFGGLMKKTIGHVHAVNGVNLNMQPGQTLGIVGESGCGKSTLGKAILNLLNPTEGEILFKGQNIHQMQKTQLAQFRQKVQMIFQDPYASLNSRWSVFNIIEEPFLIHKKALPQYATRADRKARIYDLMEKVGLPRYAADRYPYEFSGGQRQRIGIARALALNPELIVCDEPVSALDVSIQGQIINLLLDLQKELKLSYVFISHDLSVVRHISSHVFVMYLGHGVELADSKQIYQNPQHPYTKALLSAIPKPSVDQDRPFESTLQGEIPSPRNLPKGCPFHSRCPLAETRCQEKQVELKLAHNSQNHYHACHLLD
jgi:oligopeptide/dipeptide ABC transporter ATP-binding protein